MYNSKNFTHTNTHTNTDTVNFQGCSRFSSLCVFYMCGFNMASSGYFSVQISKKYVVYTYLTANIELDT